MRFWGERLPSQFSYPRRTRVSVPGIAPREVRMTLESHGDRRIGRDGGVYGIRVPIPGIAPRELPMTLVSHGDGEIPPDFRLFTQAVGIRNLVPSKPPNG